jgi:hypothetical protein
MMDQPAASRNAASFLAFTGNGFVPHASWSGAPRMDTAMLFIGSEGVGVAGGVVAGQST